MIGEAVTEATLTYTLYPCPLPGCDWKMTSEPGPAEQDGALAEVFGWGVFAAVAKAEREQRTERELAEHLRTHTVQEFGIALANANKRIADLEDMSLQVRFLYENRLVGEWTGVTEGVYLYPNPEYRTTVTGLQFRDAALAGAPGVGAARRAKSGSARKGRRVVPNAQEVPA